MQGRVITMTYEIISERKVKNPEKLTKPEEIYKLLKRYAKARQEQFIVMTLDGLHQPISISLVFIGTMNRIMVHPREVFHRAVRDMAAAVVVCHNHPSGDLQPSPEDLDMTRKIWKAGIVLGINVLDHLIIGKKGFYSFRMNGDLPLKEEEP
jgi:DNA repair protein RadC